MVVRATDTFTPGNTSRKLPGEETVGFGYQSIGEGDVPEGVQKEDLVRTGEAK